MEIVKASYWDLLPEEIQRRITDINLMKDIKFCMGVPHLSETINRYNLKILKGIDERFDKDITEMFIETRNPRLISGQKEKILLIQSCEKKKTGGWDFKSYSHSSNTLNYRYHYSKIDKKCEVKKRLKKRRILKNVCVLCSKEHDWDKIPQVHITIDNINHEDVPLKNRKRNISLTYNFKVCCCNNKCKTILREQFWFYRNDPNTFRLADTGDMPMMSSRHNYTKFGEFLMPMNMRY